MNLIIASSKERNNPGCFQEIFSKLQVLNSLPVINTGDIDLSDLIIFPHVEKSIDGDIRTDDGTADVGHDMPSVSSEDVISLSTTQDIPSMVATSSYGGPSGATGAIGISIIKKKTAPRVTKHNLATLYGNGSVYFESRDNSLSQDQCLKLLIENGTIFEIANASLNSS